MFEHKSPEQELQIKINFVFGIGNRKYKPERHKLTKSLKNILVYVQRVFHLQILIKRSLLIQVKTKACQTVSPAVWGVC